MSEGESETLSSSGVNVTEPFSLIQEVLRESYLENTMSLRDYAAKVKHFNKQKKSIRTYLEALREYRKSVLSVAQEQGINLCDKSEEDSASIARLMEENATAYNVAEIEHEMCIPDRVPRSGVNNIELLDDEIATLEQRLNSVGDDAQLANVDLQNILQKQQQTLQTLSNISRLLHESSMAVIRNIGA